MKKYQRFLSFSLAVIVALTLIAGNFLVSPVPAAAAHGNPHLIKTFPGPEGKNIDEVVFPSKPPVDKIKSSISLPSKGAGVNYIADSVPAFDWSYGCSATSAAMLFGYYDRAGYANFYTGPANGGVCPLPSDSNQIWGYTDYKSVTCYECPVSATHQGVDGRGARGHVDDYWIDYGNNGSDPYAVNGWTQHSSDSVGDFMGTNQNYWHNSDGSTTFFFNTDGSPLYDYSGSESSRYRDGAHGMKLFAQSKGYTVASVFNQYIQGQGSNPALGFTFANYVAEIDAGRPVLIQVSGHTMIGFGYNTTGNQVYLHNTWGFYDDYMTWGGVYSGMQHYGVSVLRLAPVNPDVTPPSVTINQASGQTDPTSTSPVNFTVIFSEPVTGFATGDVTITGTAPGTKTGTVTGSGTTYNVAVSGLTGNGTVVASIPAGVATDSAGNANQASTSTDNTVTFNYAVQPPKVTSVNPNQGKQNRTLSVTIAGTNLTGATKVDFGSGITVNSLTVKSSTQVAVYISISRSAATGYRNVAVTTPGGTGTLNNGFRVTR
jgi:hypothetical protein